MLSSFGFVEEFQKEPAYMIYYYGNVSSLIIHLIFVIVSKNRYGLIKYSGGFAVLLFGISGIFDDGLNYSL